MKKCRKCGVEKELGDFYAVPRNRDGRMGMCKPCFEEQRRERQRRNDREYYKRHRAEILEKKAAQYQDEEFREGRKVYLAEWREREGNRQRVRDLTKRWRSERPGYTQRWFEANREKQREYQHRARAKRAAVMVGEIDHDAVVLRDEGRCGICGEPIMGPLHIDHIIPLGRGGTHEMDNVQLAHPTCNHRKGAKLNFSLV